MKKQIDPNLPRFASEVPEEELKGLLSLMKRDIIDLTHFEKGEILIDEDLEREIVDISMANFWDSHFRRYDMKTGNKLYASDDLKEGHMGLTAGSEELRGSLVGYSFCRKYLADNVPIEEKRRKQFLSMFGEKY